MGAEQFTQYCKDNGLDISVVELDKSTRTAQLAAEAIGTELGSIVKSLVFLADGKPALVLVAGDRRADTRKLAQVLEAKKVKMADADTVRAETGFAIGGVPPVGHHTRLPTIIDRSLSRFETVYAAAGSPRAVFPIAYDVLLQVTAGQVADVTGD
ncbi:MAG: YbaK/EbsC family protein [Anaerolineales bacterium]|nr:MAG: YbaK/EbsC family protein [Anaerolineales bacterium]